MNKSRIPNVEITKRTAKEYGVTSHPNTEIKRSKSTLERQL